MTAPIVGLPSGRWAYRVNDDDTCTVFTAVTGNAAEGALTGAMPTGDVVAFTDALAAHEVDRALTGILGGPS